MLGGNAELVGTNGEQLLFTEVESETADARNVQKYYVVKPSQGAKLQNAVLWLKTILHCPKSGIQRKMENLLQMISLLNDSKIFGGYVLSAVMNGKPHPTAGAAV